MASLGLLAGCSGLAVPWQQSREIPVVGLLSLSLDAQRTEYVETFKQGLRDLDHVEGRTLTLEIRHADGDAGRLPALAAELVARRVAVIVAGASPEIQAARDASRTIPIVMMNSGDPVAQGFVYSLSRPGGNVTGLTNISRQVIPKRLEMLVQIVPGLSDVAVIWNPTNSAKVLELADLQAAAAAMQVNLRSLEVRALAEVEPVLEDAAREGTRALYVLGDGVTVSQAPRIASIAQAHRIPVVHEVRAFAAAGGLMAYGASIADQWRRGATYVDKILKGSKPSELPVEQPTKFDLVVNLQAARALGLTVPPSILQQASELIQ